MKLKSIYRHIFQRRLPYGLFSWRFLVPSQSAPIQFHQKLMLHHFPQIPRPLFIIIALFIGLRWVFFYSPYYSFKAVIHYGKTIQKKTKLTLLKQYWQVLHISTVYGVSPSDWYQFQMYQDTHEREIWNRIYTQETSAFHQYRNQYRPQYKEHVALLGDKWKFEKYLRQHEIISTDTLLLVPKSKKDFSNTLKELARQEEGLFCKRRTGSQGRGAFSVFLKDSQLQIQPRGEAILHKKEVNKYLQQNIKKHDYLIQRNFRHHQSFRNALSNRETPSITLRLISRIEKGDVHLEFAVLHWPVVEGEKILFYYPLAVNPHSGMLDDDYPEWPHDHMGDKQQQHLEYFIKALYGRALPHWHQAIKLMQDAHSLLAGVDQIAWDFILTDERAVLLEGNSGWGGLAICQWFGYDIERYMK